MRSDEFEVTVAGTRGPFDDIKVAPGARCHRQRAPGATGLCVYEGAGTAPAAEAGGGATASRLQLSVREMLAVSGAHR